MASRGIALDQFHKTRDHAVRRTLRCYAMRGGVFARQDDQGFVHLCTEQIDRVAPVVGELALHRGKPPSNATRCRRRELECSARGLRMKVWKARKKSVRSEEHTSELQSR